MPNYQNGKIYVIKNTINDLVYIGSTTQTLENRWLNHMNDRLKKNQKIYRAMGELGYKNFYIDPIEPYPCNSKFELWNREKHLIKEYDSVNNGYNERLPNRSQKEYREDNIDFIKEYRKKQYQEQREEILAEHKKDRQDNPEKYKEQNKKVYQQRKNNTEYQTAKTKWRKQDQAKNPEKYKAYQNTTAERHGYNNIITCICGAKHKKMEHTTHLKTSLFHIAYLFSELPFYVSRKDAVLEDRSNGMKVKDILLKHNIKQSTYYNIIKQS